MVPGGATAPDARAILCLLLISAKPPHAAKISWASRSCSSHEQFSVPSSQFSEFSES